MKNSNWYVLALSAFLIFFSSADGGARCDSACKEGDSWQSYRLGDEKEVCVCLPKGESIIKKETSTVMFCNTDIPVSTKFMGICKAAIATIPAACAKGAKNDSGSDCGT